jgi:gamma-glutamyltranspeptidase / glutathione hydrolase
LVNIIEFGMSTEDAVYKPKFHHQWLPDTLEVEKGFPQAVREALQKKGYAVSERGAIGRTEVIKVLDGGPSTKLRFEAVADIRGDDDAEGW